MTKHVEIWTLSKESRVVPHMTSEVEFWEYLSAPDMYARDGKFTDLVECRHMDIIQVTKCSAIYDRMKIDSKIERSDKYIAIHPDVKEAISVKYKAEIDSKVSELIVVNNYLTEVLVRIDNFKVLPWYKRVWKAICNDI